MIYATIFALSTFSTCTYEMKVTSYPLLPIPSFSQPLSVKVTRVGKNLTLEYSGTDIERTITVPVSSKTMLEGNIAAYSNGDSPGGKALGKRIETKSTVIQKSVQIDGIECSLTFETARFENGTFVVTSYVPVDVELRELVDSVMTVSSMSTELGDSTILEQKTNIKFEKNKFKMLVDRGYLR